MQNFNIANIIFSFGEENIANNINQIEQKKSFNLEGLKIVKELNNLKQVQFIISRIKSLLISNPIITKDSYLLGGIYIIDFPRFQLVYTGKSLNINSRFLTAKKLLTAQIAENANMHKAVKDLKVILKNPNLGFLDLINLEEIQFLPVYTFLSIEFPLNENLNKLLFKELLGQLEDTIRIFFELNSNFSVANILPTKAISDSLVNQKTDFVFNQFTPIKKKMVIANKKFYLSMADAAWADSEFNGSNEDKLIKRKIALAKVAWDKNKTTPNYRFAHSQEKEEKRYIAAYDDMNKHPDLLF